MRQKSVHPESPSERIVKNIRRATRKRHSSEEKIRILAIPSFFEIKESE
jgi:transposase